ncbi:carbohydrate ABC transporter permease [Vallitalea maricola]|uniref:Carbohydrate ABC transporter permease n=1 Tax=Vallitalea maricola TaxID=3074433 RepID=A0ACB5UJJ4_9FIRM|nr:carbohydrate ABC transporter permease [Vallitalea sp. AN17-2]
MNETTITNMSKKRYGLAKKIAGNIIISVIFIVITLIVLTPLLITLFASFKTQVQVGTDFPLKPPTKLMWDNFVLVFTKGKILLGLKNSLILVVLTILINTILASMVAYVLARFQFRFKKVLLFIFLIGMLVPGFVTEIARFGIIRDLGLYNTIIAPVVIYAGTDLMQIYIYLQFINAIPVSLDESAKLDGCSLFGIYLRIILPNIIPAVATLAILKTVDIMNDMYVPYLYMPSDKLRTLTTSLMSFAGQRSGSIVELSAGVIIVMIPTLLLYIFFQKFIFKGIVAGAVKE